MPSSNFPKPSLKTCFLICTVFGDPPYDQSGGDGAW